MKTFEIAEGRGRVAYARTQSANTLPQCDDHGRMDDLDPGAFTVTVNGTTWRLREGAEAFACPACVDAHLRGYGDSRGDVSLLREAAKSEWRSRLKKGQMDRELFAPIETDFDEATVIGCPLCFEVVDATEDGVIDCSIHGRFRVPIERVEEVTA